MREEILELQTLLAALGGVGASKNESHGYVHGRGDPHLDSEPVWCDRQFHMILLNSRPTRRSVQKWVSRACPWSRAPPSRFSARLVESEISRTLDVHCGRTGRFHRNPSPPSCSPCRKLPLSWKSATLKRKFDFRWTRTNKRINRQTRLKNLKSQP